MAGNVWEYTSTTYCDYPYTGIDGREDREKIDEETDKVLRGGSWGDDPRDVRTACRYAGHNVLFHFTFGVRLVQGGMSG